MGKNLSNVVCEWPHSGWPSFALTLCSRLFFVGAGDPLYFFFAGLELQFLAATEPRYLGLIFSIDTNWWAVTVLQNFSTDSSFCEFSSTLFVVMSFMLHTVEHDKKINLLNFRIIHILLSLFFVGWKSKIPVAFDQSRTATYRNCTLN